MVEDSTSRLIDILWYVGFFGFFPVTLIYRIGGHPDWNRHVMYRAITDGLLEQYRCEYKKRVIRTLRITDAGLELLAQRDRKRFNLVVTARRRPGSTTANPEKIARAHAMATGYIMASNAGAAVMPEDKPSLLSRRYGESIQPDPDTTYYYTAWEARAAIREVSEQTTPKTSRLLGVIVRGRSLYFLYYTGNTRMYWLGTEEYNAVASFNSLLNARGFSCDIRSQVIIGNTYTPALRIAHYGINTVSRYFTVSDEFASCCYVTNNTDGEWVLGNIVDPVRRHSENQLALDGFVPPDALARTHDAVTPDGRRAVVLCHDFDLHRLLTLESPPRGFRESLILMCYDFQAEAIQRIVGPTMEVRTFNEKR